MSRMDEVLDGINDSLEAGLSLIISQSMSMSMSEGNGAIGKCVVLDAELEKNIFATSITGTTIQDSSKKERSNVSHVHY